MESCYLETKWIILRNKTSNLNRWTTNWNISRDCNGIQKQISWSHTFKLAWWSCKYLHINQYPSMTPMSSKLNFLILESMHQSVCMSSSQYRHFEECEKWVNCTLGIINMFTRNKITIPCKCKAFITKWTWQEEKFTSKNWKTMIINQKHEWQNWWCDCWMLAPIFHTLDLGANCKFLSPLDIHLCD
jgi:hypothetical protein